MHLRDARRRDRLLVEFAEHVVQRPRQLRSHAAEGDGEEHMYYYGRRRYGRGRRSFMFGRLGRFGRSGRWARIRILRALRRQMAMNQPDDQGDDDDQSSDMGADQG